jgi:hypothetical protein
VRGTLFAQGLFAETDHDLSEIDKSLNTAENPAPLFRKRSANPIAQGLMAPTSLA